MDTQRPQGCECAGQAHVRTGRKYHLQDKERTSGETRLAGSLLLDFQPPDCGKINFGCLSPSVCSTLFHHPLRTNAYGNSGDRASSSRGFCHALHLGVLQFWLADEDRHDGGLCMGGFCAPGLEVVHTCTHILLAKSHSRGHSQLQGRLGNVLWEKIKWVSEIQSLL